MNPGDGVRLSVTYRAPHASDPPETGDARRTVISTSTVNGQPYIEADVTELEKLIRRRGGPMLALPGNEVARVEFGDTVVNFPTVLHSGEAAHEVANDTVGAITALCLDLLGKDIDRLFSFAIGIRYPERIVTYSVAGHLIDLASWLEAEPSRFPVRMDAVASWIEAVHEKLPLVFSPRASIPLDRLLQRSGLLNFERRFLDPSLYSLSYDESSRSAGIRLKVRQEDAALASLFQSRLVDFAAANRILQSSCTHCGVDYATCPCSKYLDVSVCQRIEKMQLIGVFITNRKA